MIKIYTRFLALLVLLAAIVPSANGASANHPLAFPVAPHDNVTIEWWYLNAHVTTSKNRHLAIIGSFFRFGNAKSSSASGALPLLSHYLIYAITDEDAKTHVAYSLADRNTLGLMQQLATLALFQNPSNEKAQELLVKLNKGELPGDNSLIDGKCVVKSPPFCAAYGNAGAVQAVAGKPNTFKLRLGSGIGLTFTGQKTPMYVGGDGNTGVNKPDDMKYISLTRCGVSGSIDTGSGPEKVSQGIGWFDHQWGDTWTTEAVGWDWWGVQLDDGRDILFFRQRRMSDGSIFQPLATIEDNTGKLTITRNIKFTADPLSIWESPKSHVRYPLTWTVDLPDQHLSMKITPEVQDQEMPVLASGGAIWEGSCDVTATSTISGATPISGKAYQELVGYGSPIVAKQLASNP